MTHLHILGIRGIPARYGGFETFAERLAIYFVEHGWKVTVYCQEDTNAYRGPRENFWYGIRLIHIPVTPRGAIGTILFDWKAICWVLRMRGLVLTLGYNTALFNYLLRLMRIPNIINMDGIEWRRDKWGTFARNWLRANEHIAVKVADHLIADNPVIAEHLTCIAPHAKITMIPYGADAVESADPALLAPLSINPDGYVLVIARPEPDNSILEIVTAFSARPRGLKLVILGTFRPDTSAYHRAVMASASDEVLFPGAIYDRNTVDVLRYFARLYIHGHKVGGTNPSLVEALGAGSPILAHDNPFNRWVAGEAACYFTDVAECKQRLNELLSSRAALDTMRGTARARHTQLFLWNDVLTQYDTLLNQYAS
jgi:glycosyltransferase involved in cell wall biosynthesis